MAIYYPPSMQGFTPRRIVFSTWVGHLFFAYDLMAAVRPATFVELGVFNGLSYFGFCQAVEEHGLETRCFGIDTWLGDEHTSWYGKECYEDVREHHDTHYSGFSTLLRMTFNEAAPRFASESVDLIHLDGLHTYEAALHDFETWYPRLVPGGIFLFHDVRARHEGFGVWRLWEALEGAHETFAFDHDFGLGVLRKPAGDRTDDPELIELLFSADPGERRRLRELYAHTARHAELQRKERRRRNLAEKWAREGRPTRAAGAEG